MPLTVTSLSEVSILRPAGRLDQASANAFLSALQPYRASCTGDSALPPLVREVFASARFDLVTPCFERVDDAITGLSA